MAEVYLAVAQGVGGFSKLHVIKRLRDELASEAEFLVMFLDEARLAARLNHPNIVQTYEVAVEDDQHFLVMEYVDGEPLRRLVRRARDAGDPLPLSIHVKIIHDMLAGLHHAHEAKDFDGTPLQIVHRDVSPHNVLVTTEGHVKLLDFGVAKAVNTRANTVSGAIKGKVRYLAPEQVAGEKVDRRSDLFAVGVMLWEALADGKFWGELPDYRILARLLSGDLPPVEVGRSDPCAQDLARIVEKALAVKPEHRYSTAVELRDDLAALLARTGQRPSEEAIGAFVARVFADRRAQIHEAIERKLAALGEDDFSSPLLDLRSVHTLSSRQLRNSDPTLPVGSGSNSGLRSAPSSSSSSEAADTVPAPADAHQKRSWLRPVALVAVAVCVVGVAVMLAFRSPDERAATESPASVAPSAQTQTVLVEVETTPARATISLDGVELGGNPYRGSHPKDDREHVIGVRAVGFDEQKRTVSFSDDVKIQVVLVASAAASAEPVVSTEPARSAPVRVPSNPPRTPPPQHTKPAPKHGFDPGDPWR
jgi:serine/threonine-protein kinase